MLRGALVGFVLLASGPALGDPSAADKKRAGELATESSKHYKRGEFEVSVALLRKAYTLYPEPNLLYNLARSLEGMGDKRGAIDAYNKYLASAKRIEDRGALRRRVALLERELADKQRREVELEERRREPGAPARPPTRPERAPSPARPSPAQPSPARPSPAHPSPAQPQPAVVTAAASPPLDAPLADPFTPQEKVTPPSKLPWIPIGIGVVAISGGIGFGLRARDFEGRSEQELDALESEKLHVAASDNARLANIMFVAGGAVLAGGIVWEIFVLRAQAKKRDAVNMRPTFSGNVIGLEWTLP